MRKISLILTLLGILILLILLNLQNSIKITNNSQIKDLEDNAKIQLTGLVTSQTNSQIIIQTKSDEIKLSCDNCPNYKNKSVTAYAITENYNKRVYLTALSIKENDS